MNTRHPAKQDLDALVAWYQSAVGESLKAPIAFQLSAVLTKLSVQDILFLGVAGFEQQLITAKGKHAMFFTDVACEHLLANEDSYLPIKSDSQECVVLLHGLDIAMNPQAVLREMSRIVAKDGYLIIIGFNRYSAWGLYRPLRRIFNWHAPLIPWRLKFHGMAKLGDWLELLGFESGQFQTLGFRPLIQNSKVYRPLAFFEWLGRLVLPGFGNVYIRVARKRTIPLTPEPMLSRLRAGLIKAGLPKASTEGV
ncbi:MAG: class I SAM-dependent methyltransferase [Gammaproteobacteria bacterium]|nr:class I SAM-dependent methyltransferase [Gammaproteobacteria bacterium]